MMNKEMPSQEEQDAVVWYVLKRPLVRPNTSYTKMAIYIAIFVLANAAITALLYYLFRWLGISAFLPESFARFQSERPTMCFTILAIIQFFIGGIIALKPAIIGSIRLYQRYAPERIRRRCLLKPTCSEYAILAIEKYGVIKGAIMTHKRLNKTCRGIIYREDCP